MAPARQAKRSSAPVFIACKVTMSLSPSGFAPAKRPSAARSSICPPAMPPRPAARASSSTSVARTPASGCTSGPRHQIEGEGEQAVAGQDRGRLVEGLVRGGAAAAQVVVVHRRQVVVHQRIAVHAFERGAGQQRAVMGGAEQAGAFDQQKRAHALAAAQRRIAHGLEQPRRPGDLVGDRLCPPAGGRAALRFRRRRRTAVRQSRWNSRPWAHH